MTETSSGLSRDQVATLRRDLLNARGQILDRAHSRFHELGSATAPDPEDAGDFAKREVDESIIHLLDETDRERLAAIDEALARMDAGSYGLSVESGEPIGFERLRAEPWALRSLADQEEYERRR